MKFFTTRHHKNCPLTASFNKLMDRQRQRQRQKRLSTDDTASYTTESSSSDDPFHYGISSDNNSSSSLHLRNGQEMECIEGLKDFCRSEGIDFSDALIFRFACFHNFCLERTKEAIDENRDNEFLNLTMKSNLRRQFVTKSLFPLPELRTVKRKSQVIYTRPTMQTAEEADMTRVIESLCYVLNDLSQTEEECRNGVAMVTNLRGFGMEHYDYDQWFQFIMVMQGTLVPTKINLALIVDPPSWFKKDIWKKIRPMLPSSFARRVHIITSDKLGDYLMEGYKAYLPRELAHGYRDTEEIIEDYIDLKTFQDSKKSQSHLMVAAN